MKKYHWNCVFCWRHPHVTKRRVFKHLPRLMFARNSKQLGRDFNAVPHSSKRKLFSSPWGLLTFASPRWGLFNFHPHSVLSPPFPLCARWCSRRTAALSSKSHSLASGGKNTGWGSHASGRTWRSASWMHFHGFYAKTICRRACRRKS